MVVEHDHLGGRLAERPQGLVRGRDVDEHDQRPLELGGAQDVVVTARYEFGALPEGAPYGPRGAEPVRAARMEEAGPFHAFQSTPMGPAGSLG